MKIIIVGATGTLGKAIANELGQRHEIIRAGYYNGEVQVDMTSPVSIEKLFAQTGAFDALVCAAGGGSWGPFSSLKEEDFFSSIRSKLMGQVNLVLTGRRFINPGGSFTLTSGILADEPVRGAITLSVAGAAVNAFVTASAIELEQGVRINTVSPGVAADSADKYGPLFPGHVPVPMNRIVASYVKSVEGALTGQVFRVHA